MAKAKVSHLQESKKSDQPTRAQIEELAITVEAVLTNPACPEKLHSAITDALSEIETGADTLSFHFLFGLFQAPSRKAEGGAQ